MCLRECVRACVRVSVARAYMPMGTVAMLLHATDMPSLSIRSSLLVFPNKITINI